MGEGERVEVKARRFLELLFGSGDDTLSGYLFIASFPDGKFNRKQGPTKRDWFLWPDDHERALAYIIRNRSKDLYTAPTLYTMKGSAKAKNAKAGRVLYADADSCHPRNFLVVPTLITETSPGRYQCFWVVDGSEENVHSPEKLSRYSRRIAHSHINAGCDPSGFAVGHLMRIPQTTNNKPDVGQWTVRAAAEPARIYTYGGIEKYYARVDPPTPEQKQADPPPARQDLPSREEAEKAIHTNPVMLELYKASGVQGHPTASRSHILWKFLCEMSRLGIDKTTALVLAVNAKSNKWAKQPGGGWDELWRQLCKAYADPENQPPVNAEDFTRLEQARDDEQSVAVENGQVVANVPVQGTPVRLLGDNEHGLVPQDTLVDVYERWAQTKTDAATQFHRAAFLSVLATVLGDFGRPGAKFMEQGPLNLWFLILGGTTRSRKTTAQKFATRMLKELQRPEEGYHYLLGGDVTAEGLNGELADHPGRSKLLDRDEAHGWFQEMESKPYMHALKQTLASLYDGETTGQLRATKDKTKAGMRTSLNLYLLGVTEYVCRQLNTEDYASGFLNRFLYVHAPPPPRTPESVQVDEVDPNTQNLFVDLERDTIVEQLFEIRSFWESETGGAPGHPEAMAVITCTEEALQRFNRFAVEASDHAADHPLADALEPAVDRFTKSVLKCIYLLAMARKKRRADIDDVRKVLSWAEYWYGDMVFVAHHVHANAWSRKVDEVQRRLAEFSGTSVPWYRIYNKVRKDYSPKEFKEVVMALQQSNLVRVESGSESAVITKIDW